MVSRFPLMVRRLTPHDSKFWKPRARMAVSGLTTRHTMTQPSQWLPAESAIQTSPARQAETAGTTLATRVRVRGDGDVGELFATRWRPGARHGSDDPLASAPLRSPVTVRRQQQMAGAAPARTHVRCGD
jgi:hypothetical protein